MAAFRSVSLVTVLLLLLRPAPAAAATAALPPNDAAARRNAFAVFNAVHAGMRQWGSALNHNGMSLFLATVPEGQLFYRGGGEPQPPAGVDGSGAEWLAFEVEHAQVFASPVWQSGRAAGVASSGPPGQPLSENRPPQQPLGGAAGTKADTAPWTRGYLQTYRANRPLNLLVFDGMAAGKAEYGCLDTQDLLLLDWRDDGSDRGVMRREYDRVLGLCALAEEWAVDGSGTAAGTKTKIDGFVRAEAGFEIIYCDLGSSGRDGGGGDGDGAGGAGLDLVSVQASPLRNETGGLPGFTMLEFLRGVALRYHGFPAGRIAVDWSSMVSALFYDVNLTNPDPARPELPRLVGVPRGQRRSIRARVQQVVTARLGRAAAGSPAIDWQGIVDLVVSRYAQRLQQLAQIAQQHDGERAGSLPLSAAPVTAFLGQMLPMLLNPYRSYGSVASGPPPPLPPPQLGRCTSHFLAGALAHRSAWTPEDHALFAAVGTVTRTICTSLFEMEAVIAGAPTTVAGKAEQETAVRRLVAGLMGQLQWTTWRECEPCRRPDEMCFVAMYPWGDAEDHFQPRCRPTHDLEHRDGYWN